MENPLIKGGCGHSDEDVTKSAAAFATCAGAAIIVILAILMTQ